MTPKLFLDYHFIGYQSIFHIIWGDARFNNSHFILQKWFEMRHHAWFEYLKYSKHSWPSPQPSWKPPRNFLIMHDIHHSIAHPPNNEFACGTLFLSNLFGFLNLKILLCASFLMYILKSMSKRWIDLPKTLKSIGNNRIHYSKINWEIDVMV